MKNIETFKNLLDQGNDNALIRFSLGNEYLKQQDYQNAILHLEKTIEFNPSYSMAWKLYARALAENNQLQEAIIAYKNGIRVAEENGDKQAVKEMQVFLKRLEKF